MALSSAKIKFPPSLLTLLLFHLCTTNPASSMYTPDGPKIKIGLTYCLDQSQFVCVDQKCGKEYFSEQSFFVELDRLLVDYREDMHSTKRGMFEYSDSGLEVDYLNFPEKTTECTCKDLNPNVCFKNADKTREVGEDHDNEVVVLFLAGDFNNQKFSSQKDVFLVGLERTNTNYDTLSPTRLRLEKMASGFPEENRVRVLSSESYRSLAEKTVQSIRELAGLESSSYENCESGSLKDIWGEAQFLGKEGNSVTFHCSFGFVSREDVICREDESGGTHWSRDIKCNGSTTEETKSFLGLYLSTGIAVLLILLIGIVFVMGDVPSPPEIEEFTETSSDD